VTLNADRHPVYRFRMGGAVSPLFALQRDKFTLNYYCNRNFLDNRPRYLTFQEIALCEELASEEAMVLSKDRLLNEMSCSV